MQGDEVNSIVANPDKNKGRRGLIIGIIAIIVLIAGVGVGIFLVQQNQEIRNQAAGAGTCAYTVTGECLATESWCRRDFRCYPASSAAQINCVASQAPEDIDKRIDNACKNGNRVTICGKTQTWGKFDNELEKANYPGPFNHARTEARAYIGAACPETLSQIPTGTEPPSPSPSPSVSPNPTVAASATPAPTATSSSSNNTTPTPTPRVTPTPTSAARTSTPTPAATNRVSVVTSDQGIPNTGTGTPAILGAAAGILLLVGAIILAL